MTDHRSLVSEFLADAGMEQRRPSRRSTSSSSVALPDAAELSYLLFLWQQGFAVPDIVSRVNSRYLTDYTSHRIYLVVCAARRAGYKGAVSAEKRRIRVRPPRYVKPEDSLFRRRKR